MPKKVKDKVDKELFEDLYTKEKMTIGELALRFEISPATATVIRKELGLPSVRSEKPSRGGKEIQGSAAYNGAEIPEGLTTPITDAKPAIKNGGNWVLYTDAATIGSLGDMGIGYVFFRNGNIEKIGKKKLKTQGTNNEAEYKAIIAALTLVKSYEPESVVVKSDSQLAINQINGVYDINTESLREFHQAAIASKNEISCECNFMWIPRDENKLADALASLAVGMPMAVINPDMTFEFWDVDDFPIQGNCENLPEINDDCRKTIETLNALEKAKFSDFTGLKTFGIDPYSKMGEGDLRICIEQRFSKDTYAWVDKVLACADNYYKLSALKWIARGLNPDLALKKVSVDKELSAQKNRV